jgi:hypothetical protein
MVQRHRPSKKGDRPLPLMQHSVDARPRCVAVDDEWLSKVREFEHRRRRERCLQGLKRRRYLR